MMKVSPRSTFFLACLFSRIALLVFLLTAGIGLMPDEAQYWTWSRLLDIGYYSKPPGIAWQIAAGTSLFGQTELGVRCIACILPIASALVIQKIVLLIGGTEKTGYLAASAFILSPLGMTSSFLATSDSPMVFWWLCSLFFYLKLWDSPKRYIVTGLFIGLGAVWKWMIYSFWIILAIEFLFRKKDLSQFLLGLCISLCGLLPSLLWNVSHEYATFRHVGTTIAGAHGTIPSPNPLSFFFAGIALITPGFFLLALPAFASKDPKTRLLQVTVYCIWGGLLLLSFTRKMQGNWAVASQVMFFPLIGLVLAKRQSWQRWPYIASICIAITLQIGAQASAFLGKWAVRANLFKQGIGNDQIASALEKAGYNPSIDFLFSDRYQTTSQLWFYGVGQQQAYFLNLHNLRQNQYSFWPGMKEKCVGKTGYFVAIFPYPEGGSVKHWEKHLHTLLIPYFGYVHQPTVHTLFSRSSTPIRTMIIIKCQGYTGKTPKNPHKF